MNEIHIKIRVIWINFPTNAFYWHLSPYDDNVDDINRHGYLFAILMKIIIEMSAANVNYCWLICYLFLLVFICSKFKSIDYKMKLHWKTGTTFIMNWFFSHFYATVRQPLTTYWNQICFLFIASGKSRKSIYTIETERKMQTISAPQNTLQF